jgi:hypothetical protein
MNSANINEIELGYIIDGINAQINKTDTWLSKYFIGWYWSDKTTKKDIIKSKLFEESVLMAGYGVLATYKQIQLLKQLCKKYKDHKDLEAPDFESWEKAIKKLKEVTEEPLLKYMQKTKWSNPEHLNNYLDLLYPYFKSLGSLIQEQPTVKQTENETIQY